MTTGNRRKAQFLRDAYDDLEERIAALREKEELDSIRPELSGEDIMALLNIPPSPVVGRAYKFLLNLRMDEGEVGRDVATQRLLDWWSDQEA